MSRRRTRTIRARLARGAGLAMALVLPFFLTGCPGNGGGTYGGGYSGGFGGGGYSGFGSGAGGYGGGLSSGSS
jgi:uncharacterized protein